MHKLSIIIPLYNEEESLHELHAEIDAVAKEHDLNLEIIMVDDGSRIVPGKLWKSWPLKMNVSTTLNELQGRRPDRRYAIRFRSHPDDDGC
ncbi:MAG: glycosyltransferase [Planctomycetaceae bacterium]